MKIKISKSPIFNILMIILALDFGFTNIFNIPVLGVYANYSLVIVVTAALLFLNSIVNTSIYNSLKPYRNFIYFDLIVVALFIVVITLLSYNKYGQSLSNYYSCFRSFLYFILVVPFIFVFTRQNGYKFFMNTMMWITIAYIALCIINSLHYTLRGYLLFENLTFGIREDRLRCQAPSSFYIILPYVLNKIFDEKLKKDKAKWIAIFALFVFFIYYICMTRMITTAFYALIALTLVLRPKNPNVRKTILIVYAIVFLILLTTGQITNIVEMYRASDKSFDQSTLARQQSLQYFSEIAKDNPLFAMGFVSPTNTYFSSIFFGPKYSCFFDDLGIYNIYLHYGCIGVIAFGIIVIRLAYLLIKIYFINKSPNKALFAGIFLFTAFTQVSLSMFDGQRIMGAVILWALFEYEAYVTSSSSEKRKKLIQIRRDNENHTIQLRMDKPRR